jgi:ribose/xylose/arabinose/galactoside ABC-type transport system permease subunit
VFGLLVLCAVLSLVSPVFVTPNNLLKIALQTSVVAILAFGQTFVILTAGDPNAGPGYELDVIAAAVIGGSSPSGGRGGVFGTLIRALIIAVLCNGMVLLNVSPYWSQAVKGVIMQQGLPPGSIPPDCQFAGATRPRAGQGPGPGRRRCPFPSSATSSRQP